MRPAHTGNEMCGMSSSGFCVALRLRGEAGIAKTLRGEETWAKESVDADLSSRFAMLTHSSVFYFLCFSLL